VHNLLSIVAWLGQTAPRFHEGSNETLSTWKAILTTPLLALALWQALDQAVVRGRIHAGRSQAHLLLRLHHFGGVLAPALVLVLSGLGLWAMFGLDAQLETGTAVLHAVLRGLAASILLGITVIANRFRQKAHVNVPLGIAAGATLVAIFLITALPHSVDMPSPAGTSLMILP
jgi:hypothetical protein